MRTPKHSVFYKLSCMTIVGALVLLFVSTAPATEPQVAFLIADASAGELGPESNAAYQLARQLVSAVRIMPAEDGKFVDREGREVSLGRFRVIWCHQGDSIEQTTAIYDARCGEALRKYVAEGGGLYLSGAALAMVNTLGIETAKPRLGSGGEGPYLAGLVPQCDGHPIFSGLDKQGVDLPPRVGGNSRQCSIPINDAGYPAFADFHGSGGPRNGMLLARASAGAENPLVEYEVGSGRVIALGWRVPRYAHPDNAHRDNLQRLTENVIRYLGDDRQWQAIVLQQGKKPQESEPGVPDNRWRALKMAVTDLIETFKDGYSGGPAYLERIDAIQQSHDDLLAQKDQLTTDQQAELDEITRQFGLLQEQALLANPLLDFDGLMLIERGQGRLGLPANWQSNSSLPTTGYDNRLAVLSPVGADGRLSTLYRPEGGRFIGDVDLHFHGERMLFSMPGSNGRWQIFEMDVDGSNLRELPLINQPDVDNYDACYLPDGRVVFSSTAPFVGVPCVYGSSHVTNLYLRETDGSIRQLTVDQEHNWCPAVTNGGRVLYLRWEYSDLPHSNSRILFHMNPDGSGQMEYYGSNSFFTNSFFYARPIPGHPTKVVGIATGHHGVARAGRMLVIDPARGRHEADGVVQEIPGWGKKVEALILDPLVDGVWPQFLHPYPLSEKYFLTSAKPGPSSTWGIYLVDTFDNMTLLKETPGYALLEPVPIRKTPTPPEIRDRVDPTRKDALVYLTDVHEGPGLEGIPRGTVKKLRLVGYHFSYRGMGGLLGAVGMDGPWDVKRVLGTVPVEPDGSAAFRVPAYTPIAVQPLDEDGQALQIMRSWFTAMPGEVLSCVGCHERQNTATPNRRTIAALRPPSKITPWLGPARGFSFHREVQPVLDRYCVGCHHGQPYNDGLPLADLRGDEMITDWTSGIAGHVNPAIGGRFSIAYGELHRYVRRPGIESNIRLLPPMEYHAKTTELIQLLDQGHYGVELDAEARNRLVTWIDLNAPYHGTWGEIVGKDTVAPLASRAREMRRLYTGMTDDPEAIPAASHEQIEPLVPDSVVENTPQVLSCPNWPFDLEEAQRRQREAGEFRRNIDLGEGVVLELVRIPAGRFVMGSSDGNPNERPTAVVDVKSHFWMGRFEVTNRQYARFDSSHQSGVESMHGYQFGIHGYPLDSPSQPVARVSWYRALAFCDWLSEKTGLDFTLPTEAQWEYACRSGTDSPASYGDLDSDFSAFANLGDAKLREFALDTYINVHLVPNPNKYDDWVPKDDRFNDGGFVSAEIGSYQPNAWHLCDLHGNVWEWTRSAMQPYPYDENDGRNDPSAAARRVVRGGSWYDRPKRCRSAFRLSYQPYQQAFNVGFRVVEE